MNQPDPAADPDVKTHAQTPNAGGAIGRRACLMLAPGAFLAGAVPAWAIRQPPAGDQPSPSPGALAALPAQDPDRVMEMVGASHGRVDRVRELLREEPRLANAAVDWGFGDWETALGAASHVGNRPIAEMLLAHGARPDIFTFAMLGRLDALKAILDAQPGLQRTLGPHGITLLAHARAGGTEAASVVEFLTALGGADERPPATPLADEVRAAVLGEYAFGEAPDQRFEVSEKNGTLWIKRASRSAARALTHVGEAVFSPAGAPEVRIAFTLEPARAARASRLRVTAPRPIIEARRV